jgi:ATP-binding cassette subfamily B protein
VEPHSNWRTFVRLLGFLRPYKWSLAVSVVLAVGSQAAAVAMAFLLGDALQLVVESEDRDRLKMLVGGVLAVGFARAALMAGRRLISGRQALAVEYDLRDAMYAKLLRLSYGFYDRHQTGQLMSRATVDLQAVRFFPLPR